MAKFRDIGAQYAVDAAVSVIRSFSGGDGGHRQRALGCVHYTSDANRQIFREGMITPAAWFPGAPQAASRIDEIIAVSGRLNMTGRISNCVSDC